MLNSNLTEKPYLVRDGVFGATFNKNGEFLYLRMELLTEKNSKCWTKYREISCWIANDNSGKLSGLVNLAGTTRYPAYEQAKEITGFTSEEYTTFTEKALKVKKKTDNKIVGLLKGNSAGINHMFTGFSHDAQNYIIYITKNPDFSIQDAAMTCNEVNLKNFIESYKDVIISVGSDFSEKRSFHNRGISRNPYWIFEEKYSGLAMLLFAFPGIVAGEYFPEKDHGEVKPIGSMQSLIKRNLLPEEGYMDTSDGTKKDITELEIKHLEIQYPTNYITIEAIKRIYQLHMWQQVWCTGLVPGLAQ